MAIHVALHHRTTYRYDRPVALGPQVVRLRPAPHCRTPILALLARRRRPSEHFLNWQQDPHEQLPGARSSSRSRRASFDVDVDLVAEMAVINPFDFFLEPAAEQYPVRVRAVRSRRSSRRTSRRSRPGRGSAALARQRRPRDRGATVDFLVDARTAASQQRDRLRHPAWSRACRRREETLALAHGLVPRLGWLLVQLLRHLGLAARFVSGYLIQLTPDVKPLDGPAGADARLHRPARLGRGLPAGRGWIGLDPTSGLLAGEGHIPLAATPEPSSAAPIDRRASTSARSTFELRR